MQTTPHILPPVLDPKPPLLWVVENEAMQRCLWGVDLCAANQITEAAQTWLEENNQRHEIHKGAGCMVTAGR